MEAALTTLIQSLNSVYAYFDRLQISVSGLVIAAVVFALALLFAVREAASWFFKVDDLKRDVRRMNSLVANLEGEIRVLQSLISQAHAQTIPPHLTSVPQKQNLMNAVAAESMVNDKPQSFFEARHDENHERHGKEASKKVSGDESPLHAPLQRAPKQKATDGKSGAFPIQF